MRDNIFLNSAPVVIFLFEDFFINKEKNRKKFSVEENKYKKEQQ